jgi:hypothetical protein
MALVTTFATTPLTTLLYPKWYQDKVDRWRRGEIDWDGNPVQSSERSDSVAAAKEHLQSNKIRRLLVYLRLDGLSTICTLAALLGPNQPPTPKVHPEKAPEGRATEQGTEESAVNEEEDTSLKVHGIRLMELTDRDSSVMKVSEVDEQSLWDPVINTFRAFGQWHNISIMAGVSVVPEHTYADTVLGMSREDFADLLLIPWSETGALSEHQGGLDMDEHNRFANGPYAGFVSNILTRSSCNVGVLVERSMYTRNAKARPALQRTLSARSIGSAIYTSPAATRSHHIVLPFFGGDDDRFALQFVLQLAQNDQVTATIIHIDLPATIPQPRHNTSDPESDITFFETLRDSLPDALSSRVIFKRITLGAGRDESAVQLAIDSVKEEMSQSAHKPGNITIVGRHNNRVDQTLEIGAPSSDEVGSDTRRVLGAVAQAMVRTEHRTVGNVLVLQAAGRRHD